MSNNTNAIFWCSQHNPQESCLCIWTGITSSTYTEVQSRFTRYYNINTHQQWVTAEYSEVLARKTCFKTASLIKILGPESQSPGWFLQPYNLRNTPVTIRLLPLYRVLANGGPRPQALFQVPSNSTGLKQTDSPIILTFWFVPILTLACQLVSTVRPDCAGQRAGACGTVVLTACYTLSMLTTPMIRVCSVNQCFTEEA